MATPLDNTYLSNFDLEYLLGPAPAVDSISGNGQLSGYLEQVETINELPLSFHVNNEPQKLENDFESLQIHCAKLENNHDSLKNDYKALKKDYAKLALDYASLQKENRDHAMSSIENAKQLDSMEVQANQYLTTINSLNKQCEIYEINIASQNSHLRQFECLVKELTTAKAELKKDIRSEKANVRDGRKMISTLHSNNETLTDHLCLLGCVIQGRRKLDKDVQRYIKKYCKKIISPKETEESYECKSVDTGRGSSLAFSDGDRSYYSPDYSSNFSPFLTCSTILPSDQTKQMTDACSSPLPRETSDKATVTSPVMFEVISEPNKNKTSDMNTSPIIFEEDKTPEATIKASVISASPETGTPFLLKETSDPAKSPIFVETVKLSQKTNTSEMSNISISFEKVKSSTYIFDMANSLITVNESETPQCSLQTSEKDSTLMLDGNVETPQKKTKSSLQAQHPLVEEDSRTQRQMAQQSNKPMNSICTIEVKTSDKATIGSVLAAKDKNTTTSSSNTASHSIFDDVKSPKHKTKKSSENSILTDEVKTTQHTTDTSNKYSIFDEDPETQHIAKTLVRATGSISTEVAGNARLADNSFNKVTSCDAEGETLKHKMEKADKIVKYSEDTEHPLQMKNSLIKATKSIFDEASGSPQYGAEKLNKVTGLTTVVEVKNCVHSTNYSNTALLSKITENREDPGNLHIAKTLVRPTGAISTEVARNTDNSFNMAPSSLFDDEGETLKRKMEKVDKILQYAEDTKHPLQMKNLPTKSTKSMFDEDPGSPQYIAEISNKVTGSTSVVEVKNCVHSTNYSNKVLFSKSTENKEATKHKTEKSDKSTSSITTEKAKTPRHTSNTMNRATELDRNCETLKPEKLSSMSSKAVDEGKSLRSRSCGMTTNSAECTRTALEKVTHSIHEIPRNLIFDDEAQTQQVTETPKITFSVIYEDSIILQDVKTPDSVNRSTEEAEETKNSRPTTEISEIKTSFVGKAQSSLHMSENIPSRTSSAASYYSTDHEDGYTSSLVSDCTDIATTSTSTKDERIASDLNSKIFDKLKEIYSQAVDNSLDEYESNLEVQMILDKHRLTLGMMSPMSITPELDRENEQSRTENEDRCNKIEAPKILTALPKSEILSQTLHDKLNEHKTDQQCHPNSSNENKLNLTTSMNCERASIQHKEYENVNDNNTAVTPHKSSQMSIKKPGIAKNNRKLSVLQKLYKNSLPKNKIKQVDDTPSKEKHHTRWTPYSIPANNFTLNKEKAVIIMAELKYKQLSSKEKNNKGKESMASRNGNLSLVPTLPGPQSVSNVEFSSHTPTEQSEPVKQIDSQTNGKYDAHKTTSCAKNTESKQMSNGEFKPTVTQASFETGPRRSSRLSIESRSNSNRRLHIPPNKLSERLPQNRDNLSKCDPPPIQTELIPKGTKSSTHLYSEKQINNSIVSQSLGKEAGIIRNSILSATHPVLRPPDNNNTNDIKADNINPEETDYFASPPSKKIRISHMSLVNARDSGNKRRICMSPQHHNEGKKSNLENMAIDMNTKSSATSNTPESLDEQSSIAPNISLSNSGSVEKTRSCTDYNDMDLFLNDEVAEKCLEEKSKHSADYNSNSPTIKHSKPASNYNGNSPTIKHAQHTQSASTEKTRSCANYNKEKCLEELEKPADNFSQVKDILSTMLEKYATVTSGPFKKKIEDPIVKDIASKIDSNVSICAKCLENQEEYKKAFNEFVSFVKSQDTKIFVSGLIKYLNDPARKAELPKFIKAKAPPIITPSEKTLIDVIQEVQGSSSNIVEDILDNIEYTLFTLDRGATPVFEIVESMAHFFAAICSICRNVSRVRIFMLNALYCISFKAMPLIKQCLDVCPYALPYEKSDLAKSPLIRCFVFMLHYYSCDDPYKRVEELRGRLKYKYYYNLLEENESTILFMFKSAITQLTENKMEQGMLRLSLLVLAKRRGTKWCHKNIVQKILLPMIRDNTQVTDAGKTFCITVLGPLLKPYKNEMIVHREEVVNLLMTILKETERHELKEDILASVITMDINTNWEAINKYLIQWTPPTVSPAFEEVLKRYIRRKHVSKWKYFYIKHYNEI